MPYKNNLSFCSLGKLSSKTVTPLYLKSSMTCCTPIHSLSLSLSFTHTPKCLSALPDILWLPPTRLDLFALTSSKKKKLGQKIWNKKFKLFLNCFFQLDAISSKKKNGSWFILPATTIIINIIITTMYCSLTCKHPLLNKRP